jgi:hypothetical protein
VKASIGHGNFLPWIEADEVVTKAEVARLQSEYELPSAARISRINGKDADLTARPASAPTRP